jgi:hypothetical protein
MREIKREIRCKSGAIPVAVKEREWRIENGEWDAHSVNSVIP